LGSDVVVLLHEASGGWLRDIDRIASGALERAARRNLERVDRTVVSTLDAEP
tara:strand:- start:726 stop:881 length:156 start_codon:yes stop_codon:yes gene_type:complete